jgi:dsRNA-specific ribonuclease
MLNFHLAVDNTGNATIFDPATTKHTHAMNTPGYVTKETMNSEQVRATFEAIIAAETCSKRKDDVRFLMEYLFNEKFRQHVSDECWKAVQGLTR